MGNHVGRIGAMAAGKAPFDAKAVQANADVVATLAALPFTAFGEGTGVGETRAKPEIWSQADKYKASAQAMTDAVAKLDAAAKTGKVAVVEIAEFQTEPGQTYLNWMGENIRLIETALEGSTAGTQGGNGD